MSDNWGSMGSSGGKSPKSSEGYLFYIPLIILSVGVTLIIGLVGWRMWLNAQPAVDGVSLSENTLEVPKEFTISGLESVDEADSVENMAIEAGVGTETDYLSPEEWEEVYEKDIETAKYGSLPVYDGGEIHDGLYYAGGMDILSSEKYIDEGIQLFGAPTPSVRDKMYGTDSDKNFVVVKNGKTAEFDTNEVDKIIFFYKDN